MRYWIIHRIIGRPGALGSRPDFEEWLLQPQICDEGTATTLTVQAQAQPGTQSKPPLTQAAMTYVI